jgi:hypothetical protein
MAEKKKKKKILASDVFIGNLTVEAFLLSLAEQTRVNAERSRVLDEQAAADRAQANADREAWQREMQAISQGIMAMAQRMDERLRLLEGAAKPAP